MGLSEPINQNCQRAWVTTKQRFILDVTTPISLKMQRGGGRNMDHVYSPDIQEGKGNQLWQ